jgi:hypothetical protein
MGPDLLWHAYGIALFIALAVIHQRTKYSGIFVLALWNLTGVILHESAHLLVGFLLRAGPTGVSLVPRRDGTSWRLGSVSFRRLTPLNAVPVALAPLCLAGVAYVLFRNWFNWYEPSLTATLALYGSLFILLYNALPSRQDLRTACNWRSMLIYIPLLVGLAWYLWIGKKV